MSASAHDSETLHPIRRRLAETTAAITKVLVEDLASYPERELQRRFVETDAADDLTSSDVVNLRREAHQLGQRFAAQVAASLAQPEPWEALLAQDLEAGEEPKSLRGIAAVWSIVAAIDTEVEQLAADWRMPADNRTPPGYVPPARFIQRQHLPTLVEHYIRDIKELRRLSVQLSVQSAEDRRRSRAERWAAAAAKIEAS